MISMEEYQDKAKLEGVILVGLVGLSSCVMMSIILFICGTLASFALKFIVLFDIAIFGLPLVSIFRSCAQINNLHQEDVDILTSLTETMLYPAEPWCGTSGDAKDSSPDQKSMPF